MTSSVSAATSLSSSPSRCSTARNGCPSGNISAARRPRNSPEEAPRNFSAAGLTITARASRVKRSKPSSSPAITEFMFSRRVLKISCTPRSCWPTWVIFLLTWPSSSLLPPKTPRSAMGASYCPAEILSSCAEMSRKGANVAPLTTAASSAEVTRASSTMVPEVFRLGAISLQQQTGGQNDTNFAEWFASHIEGVVDTRKVCEAPRKTFTCCMNPLCTSCESGGRRGCVFPGSDSSLEISTWPSSSAMETS